MKAIKIIALACIMFAFASCGALRNKHKQSAKMEVIEGAKVEQTTIEQSGSVVKVQDRETDKGVSVTERETTTVTTKEGSRGKAVIKHGELKPGENLIPMDSAVGLIKAVLDTLNKTLTLEVTTPSERTETTTKERITDKRDFSREQEREQKDTTSKQVATVSEGIRRETSATSESDSRPNVWAVLLSKIGWGITLAIVVLVVLWYLRRK